MPASLKTTLEKLQKESNLWNDQIAPLNSVASSIDGLQLTGVSAGIFSTILNTYNAHCADVSSLVQQGATEAGEVRDAIDRSAEAYRNQEAESSEVIENTFDR